MVSFGMEDFAKKYGAIEPCQFVDVMSLVGDRSDNIPGIFRILGFNFIIILGFLYCMFISTY